MGTDPGHLQVHSCSALALTAPATSELSDELDHYLSTDPEQVTDIFKWWYERKGTYPCLHRMALDYLTIPGVYLK